MTALLIAVLWPKTVTPSLGGVNIEQREPFRIAWRNPDTGWFLIRTFECDGSHRSLTITKDR